MKRKGFTLTELMVVLAIVAVLTAIAIPSVSSLTRKAGLSSDAATAQAIETGIYEWMRTDYYDDTFYRRNMYTFTGAGAISNASIGGRTEQLYSYAFAGTDQLPGIEFSDEQLIRHAAIVAIKGTSGQKIVIENREQFVEGPKTASDYGFKYYYKIGRVNTEKVDSTESALGNDPVYQYYVWLDRPGGNIDTAVVAKHAKNAENYVSTNAGLYAFNFDFRHRNINNLKVEISQEGMSHSFDAVTETPQMFKPGAYDIRLYENGDLRVELLGVVLSSTTKVVF